MSHSIATTPVEAYLRVAAMTMGGYDYLITIPAEYRLYKRQTGLLSMTPACMFFIIARYISMWALLVQVIGYMYGGWTVPSCRHWFYLGPSVRIASAAVCSLIFLWRTYIIWGRDRRVLFGISACWLGATILACCSIAGSVQTQLPDFDNCFSKSGSGPKYANYIGWMFFDLVCFVLTSYRLLRNQRGTAWHKLSVILFRDGLVYILGATGINLVNVIFFASPPERGLQSTAGTMGIAIIMILSTRTVLSLHESVTSIDPTSSHGARKSMASRSWFRRDDKKADVELGQRSAVAVEVTRVEHQEVEINDAIKADVALHTKRFDVGLDELERDDDSAVARQSPRFVIEDKRHDQPFADATR